MPTPEKVDEHNKEVASKLASQDIMGIGTAVPDNLEVSKGLDALMAEAEKKSKEPDEAPVVEPKPDASPKAGTPAEPTPEQKAAAEAAKAAADAASKRADELFGTSPQLPPNASPKSSEAFSAIKLKAAQEISAREQELEKIRKENADLQEKLKNPIPEPTQKELEELRTWRAKLDVEADPKFREFDKSADNAREFIYSLIKKNPAGSDALIAEIKKYGGPEMVKLEKFFAVANDPTLQRLIEAKVSDIEVAKWNKQQAIESAKKNISEYLSGREKELSTQLTQDVTAVESELKKHVEKLPWYKELPVDPKADENTRKGIQAHNEFVKSLGTQLEDAKKDNSPEMKAILLTGMAQLFYLQNVHAATKTENAALKKTVEELTAKMEKIKKNSLSHIRESGAPPSTNTNVTPKNKDQFNPHAGSALDAIRDQVVQERERAGK